MKILFSTMTTLIFSAPYVFAHEEGTEITDVAESDWVGPLVAVIVIIVAIIAARAIYARSGANKQIKNNNQIQNV